MSLLLFVSGCAIKHDDGSVDSLLMVYCSSELSFVGFGLVKQHIDSEVKATTSGLTGATRPNLRASFDIFGTRQILEVPVGTDRKAVDGE